MPRVKGIGMPKAKKRKVQAAEPCADKAEKPDDEAALLGSNEELDMLPAYVTALESSNQDKAARAYEQARIELLAMKEIMQEQDAKLRLEERLYAAKMKRFSTAVDRNKGSPTLQLERYYQAELQLEKAKHTQTAYLQFKAEAETKAVKALLKVRDREIACLRASGAD